MTPARGSNNDLAPGKASGRVPSGTWGEPLAESPRRPEAGLEQKGSEKPWFLISFLVASDHFL